MAAPGNVLSPQKQDYHRNGQQGRSGNESACLRQRLTEHDDPGDKTDCQPHLSWKRKRKDIRSEKRKATSAPVEKCNPSPSFQVKSDHKPRIIHPSGYQP